MVALINKQLWLIALAYGDTRDPNNGRLPLHFQQWELF